MNVHQAVPSAQAETSHHWREAVRERWRITLLSAWERDTAVAQDAVAVCTKKVVFARQEVRVTRSNAGRR